MLDPSQVRHHYCRSVLPAILLVLVVFLPPSSAGEETRAADGGLLAGDGTPPRPAAAAPAVPGEAASPPQAGQEDQTLVPGDAAPAETLVTPGDTRLLDQGEIESGPPAGAPEGPDTVDVPIDLNDEVRAYLDLFRGERRERIQEAFDRAGRYLPMMRGMFREYGLPQDLVNLAYIEMMGHHRPARTVIGVNELPKPGVLLTMNLTAVTKE